MGKTTRRSVYKGTKSSAWNFYEPGNVYAAGPFRFSSPVSEAEARADMRAWLKVKRLPRGCAVWPVR